MACVTACPSGVKYDLLVNRARAEIETLYQRPRLERLKRGAIFAMFPYHRRMRALIPLLPLRALGRPIPKLRELPGSRRTGRRGSPRSRELVGERRRGSASSRAACSAPTSPTSTPPRSRSWPPRATRSTPPPSRTAAARSSCTPARPTGPSGRAREVERGLRGRRDDRHQRGRLRLGPEGVRRPASDKVRDVTELLAEHEPRASATRSAQGRLPRRLPPRARPGHPRAAARRCCEAIPGLEILEPDQLGDLLRQRRHLQPHPTRRRRRAGRAKAAEPARHGRRGDRRRQPRLRAADPGAPARVGHDLPVYHPMELWSMEALSRPTTRQLALLNRLHDELDGERRKLLAPSAARDGEPLDFLPESEATTGDWQITPVPARARRTAASRSPARPRRRWSSTPSTAARSCFMADFEDSNSPTWANMTEGQENLAAAIRGTLRARGGRQGVRAQRRGRAAARARARPAPAREAPRHRRLRRVHGLRALRPPQPRGARRARLGPVLLHPQARVPSRGPALEPRLRDRRGGAGARARHHPRHRPDRDAPRRLPDGGDPLRAARPRRRPQRRPLGLPVLDDQVLPRAARVRAARPQPGDDDRPVHGTPTPSRSCPSATAAARTPWAA